MDWQPFLVWAAGSAVFLAGVTMSPGLVLSRRLQDDFAAYVFIRDDRSWVSGFLAAFDAVFGARALSWRRIAASALATVGCSVLLWILFQPVMGLLGTRSEYRLDLAEVVLFALLINALVDYLSLIETRWLLGRFAHVRGLAGQILLLAMDLVLTGVLIYLAINAFRLARGEPALHLFEMMAAYSPYAIFFYSTFLTSVWAWAYALGMSVVRILGSRTLFAILNHEKLFNSVMVASLERAVALYDQGCDGGNGQGCASLGRQVRGGATDTDHPLEGARWLFLRGCQLGNPTACASAGVFLADGLGGPVDPDAAHRIWWNACLLGNRWSCGVLEASSEQP